MKHRLLKAFTLTEVIVVIAIIGVVAAITFPIVASMRRSAMTTKTLQNLKSLHAGAMIYQADHHGAPVGTPEEMGLPPHEGSLIPFRFSDRYIYTWYKDMKSPFGTSKSNDYFTFAVPSKHDRLKPTWIECVTKKGDLCILYYDFFEPGKDPHTGHWRADVAHIHKRLHGITLAGNIVSREGRGQPYSQAWWISDYFAKQQ